VTFAENVATKEAEAEAGGAVERRPPVINRKLIVRAQSIDPLQTMTSHSVFTSMLSTPSYNPACVTVRLFVCPMSVCPIVCLGCNTQPSVCLPPCTSVCLSVMTVRLTVNLSIYLLVCLSIFLFVSLSICMSVSLSVRMSFHLLLISITRPEDLLVKIACFCKKQKIFFSTKRTCSEQISTRRATVLILPFQFCQYIIQLL
jgi:hypothetical protein